MSDEKKVCPRCYGREVIEIEETHVGIPITTPCVCAIARDTFRNLERGWKGITSAPRLPDSPLLGKVTQDLYLTANDSTLRAHLKYVGMKLGRNWSFQVSSDADLMTAWLANAALSGKEIHDFDVAEAASVSLSKFTLVDLVEPPGLLVLRLGVKVARNSAMSEVFHEALTLRDHANLPTWVVDQPGNRLNSGGDIPHRCFSLEVMNYLSNWEYLALDDTAEVPNLGLEMWEGKATPSASTVSAPTLSSTTQSSGFSGARAVSRPGEGIAPKAKKRGRS